MAVIEMQGGVEGTKGTKNVRHGGTIGGGIPTGVSLGVWSICLLRTCRTVDGKCWGCHGKDVKMGSVRMLRFQAGITFIQDSEYIGESRIFGFNCGFDVTCVGGLGGLLFCQPLFHVPAWLPGIRHDLTGGHLTHDLVYAISANT